MQFYCLKELLVNNSSLLIAKGNIVAFHLHCHLHCRLGCGCSVSTHDTATLPSLVTVSLIPVFFTMGRELLVGQQFLRS